MVNLRDFGGLPDSGADASGALAAAVEAAAGQGGGAVQLEAGTYLLDRPVFVRGDGVVIRGAGPDRTKILFRYTAPRRGVDLGLGQWAARAAGRAGRMSPSVR